MSKSRRKRGRVTEESAASAGESCVSLLDGPEVYNSRFSRHNTRYMGCGSDGEKTWMGTDPWRSRACVNWGVEKRSPAPESTGMWEEVVEWVLVQGGC